MNRTRALLLICAVPLLIVLGVLVTALGDGGDARPRPRHAGGRASSRRVRRASTWERGVRGAAIFRPARDAAPGPAPVVVFLHGWRAVDPSWYGLWIAHLVGEGDTVIYPAYQRRPFTDLSAPAVEHVRRAAGGVRGRRRRARAARRRRALGGRRARGGLRGPGALRRPAAPAAVFSVYPGRPGVGRRGAAGDRRRAADPGGDARARARRSRRPARRRPSGAADRAHGDAGAGDGDAADRARPGGRRSRRAAPWRARRAAGVLGAAGRARRERRRRARQASGSAPSQLPVEP